MILRVCFGLAEVRTTDDHNKVGDGDKITKLTPKKKNYKAIVVCFLAQFCQ